MQNASRKKIHNSLNELIAKSGKYDSILIFYAGHGYFDGAKTGYWVPSDARGTDAATFVANLAIRTRMAELSRKCKHVLLISNSYFNDAFLNRGQGVRGLERKERVGINSYFTEKNRYKSCQVITSGNQKYVDDEYKDEYKDSGHSPFTYFLLRKLKLNEQKYISATELFLYMEKTVANAAEQTPKYGVLKTTKDEGGEFFFVRTDE